VNAWEGRHFSHVSSPRAEQDQFDRLQTATAGLEPPFGVVDLDAFDTNADDLELRANGKPIRLAGKSLRSRALIRRALARPGFHGILGFTLPEALWLAEEFDDIVVGYPTTDGSALRMLARDERLASRITLMVDSIDHLDYIDEVTGSRRARLRICMELDCGFRLAGGRLHLGPLRSPIHTPRQAAEFARAVTARRGFELSGIMAYEGQIAGIGDNQPGSRLKQAAIRRMQRSSAAELHRRRAAAVGAVRAVAPILFVNAGGTGSLETTTQEAAVTELAAGSGLYGPALFDFYRTFRPMPAAFYVLPVVRRPSMSAATILGGGWVASGPPGKDRLPTLAWPPGLRMTAGEGAGEVQTPVLGKPAHTLRLGDRVWLRHAKAGEMCERVGELHLVQGSQVVETVPTYRGEGRHFL
jgi:D-serine deaminase-like pyridoxal phosphate-dependent protein